MKSNHEYISEKVEQYGDMIFRIAFHYVENRLDAEDVVQDTFIKLLNEPLFDTEEHLKSWLIKVTINRCKDIKKSAWRTKITELKDNYPFELQPQQSVVEEVFRLPEKYRIVIYLYYYEEYTISEIAKILNKNPITVNSQLVRARKKLKDILIDGGNHDASQLLY